eukprot:COSAG04_NODE_4238_length_2213_cov_1.321665_1_plen_120_part_00
MGAGETNIGYGRFDHVRVPRFNMLNKNDKVTETGTNPLALPTLARFPPLPNSPFVFPTIPISPPSFSSICVCGLSVCIGCAGEFIAAPPKLSKFKYIGMMNIRVGTHANPNHPTTRLTR